MSNEEFLGCADCGGFDVEWMYTCHKHKVSYCRGCDCPFCEEEDLYEYELEDSECMGGVMIDE